MTHTDPPSEPDPAPVPVAEREARFDRPDLRGPRGNPQIEQIDLERGEGKIDRVLGW